jgi:hypothetical protein
VKKREDSDGLYVIVVVTEDDCELVGDSDDVDDKDSEPELEMEDEDVIEELTDLEDDFVGEELGKAYDDAKK